MRTIKIIERFKDHERYNRIYPQGTVYEATDERAEFLVNKLKVCEYVDDQPQDKEMVFTVAGKTVAVIKDGSLAVDVSNQEQDTVEANEGTVTGETPEMEQTPELTTVTQQIQIPEAHRHNQPQPESSTVTKKAVRKK